MRGVTAALALLVVASPAPPAGARSWCAHPLVAHEWGVHVYATDGAPVTSPVALPPTFHTPARTAVRTAPVPVRDLPADNGVRFLPVLHFYSPDVGAGAIPVGVEVGFAAGPASAWYPDVDTLRPAAAANGADAAARRAELVAARAARKPYVQNPLLPADPTRQLVWDRLTLTAAPTGAPAPAAAPWQTAARQLGALWVERGGERERFLFYEGATAEPLPLRLVRDGGWAPGHRAYVLENRGARPVHDLFVTHNEAGATYVFTAAEVPAGGAVRFVLEAQAVKERRPATWLRLRQALVDPAEPAPPTGAPGVDAPCVMQRDPAVPFEEAAGYRLFAGEVELLLQVWGARFFARPGTTILWREDAATLAEAIPLSIYTDMFHHVLLRRAGLALWEDVKLP